MSASRAVPATGTPVPLSATDVARLELLLAGWHAADALVVTPARPAEVAPGDRVVLVDREGVRLAAATATAGNDGDGVDRGGGLTLTDLIVLDGVPHHDAVDLRRTPAELAAAAPASTALVAADPPAEDAVVAAGAGGPVLLLALVGAADAADPLHHARVREFRRLAALAPSITLGLVPADAGAAALARAAGASRLVVDPARPAEAAAARAAGLEPLPLAGWAAGEPVRPPGRGVTVLFTGLSGSGKSTVAGRVLVRLLAAGRTATLLDGDVVRSHLASELGFSRADRDTNVRRIGYVAAEITKHGGVALAAPIAPYAATRAQVRAMVEAYGRFVLVHVATPLEVCEARDRKGLYAKARAGLIPEFTGISDPYEAPTDADLVLDTSQVPVDEAAERVLALLAAEGLLLP